MRAEKLISMSTVICEFLSPRTIPRENRHTKNYFVIELTFRRVSKRVE